MSLITGVPDFKDFVDQYGISFCKKLNIYKGYYNYLMDIPLDTSKYNSLSDWAFLFHYCILSKSIYKELGWGIVILYERDYFSIQDDEVAASGINKKSEKGRKRFAEYLATQGISEEEIGRITRYRFELENRIDGQEGTEDVHS